MQFDMYYYYLCMQLFVTQFQKDSVIFMLLKYKDLEGKKKSPVSFIQICSISYQGQQA